MRVTRRQVLTGVAAARLIGTHRGAFAAQEPVRIGVPTSLTGPYVDLGNEVKRAIIFAMDEANASGGVDGREVQVRFLDTESKADAARQQGEKLALGGYNILTGANSSGEALALAPMLARWDAIYMATTNKADAITGSSCTARMFRANRPDSSDAAVLQTWLPTRKETKWAVVASDTAWGRNAGASLAKMAQKTGKTVVSENYPPLGTNDYAPYVQKVLDSGAEALWVPLAGRDAVNFGRQAGQFGLLAHVFTAGVNFMTDTTVKTLGDMTKGIGAVINYSSTLDTPQNKKFVADWARKYPGSEPTNFEGETYIAMQVILQAVHKAASVKPQDLAKAMEGTTFHTILGEQLMRKEDHQLVGPNFFGIVGSVGGVLRPIITMTVPEGIATPAPDGTCRLSV